MNLIQCVKDGEREIVSTVVFRTRLKLLRIEQGLRQVDLSDKSGVSQPLISFLENGKKNPTVNNLKGLAKGLKTTAGYLLGYTNLKRRNLLNMIIDFFFGVSYE